MKLTLIFALFLATTLVISCKDKNSGQPVDLHPFTKDELVGYINSKAEVKITPQFDEAGKFRSGLATVRLGKKIGYIDTQGKYVIAPRYDGGGEFSEGLAAVRARGVSFYIDKSGKKVIEDVFETASSFSEGLAAISIAGRYGYIDKSGKIAINPRFRQAGRFSQGLAAVMIGSKVGFIDKTGSLKIEAIYESASQFSEGLAAVLVDGKFGYIDLKGAAVVKATFTSASRFSQGLASVANDKGKFGYIDKKGELKIPHAYDSASDFNGLLALVSRGTDMGYIKKDGKGVWQTKLPFPMAQVRKTFVMKNSLKKCLNVSTTRLIERDGGHDLNISSAALETFNECQCPVQNVLLKITDSKGKTLHSSGINIANKVKQIATSKFRFEGEKALAKFAPPFDVVVGCNVASKSK